MNDSLHLLRNWSDLILFRLLQDDPHPRPGKNGLPWSAQRFALSTPSFAAQGTPQLQVHVLVAAQLLSKLCAIRLIRCACTVINRSLLLRMRLQPPCTKSGQQIASQVLWEASQEQLLEQAPEVSRHPPPHVTCIIYMLLKSLGPRTGPTRAKAAKWSGSIRCGPHSECRTPVGQRTKHHWESIEPIVLGISHRLP